MLKKMNHNTIESSTRGLNLFKLDGKKRLVLILCTALLWMAALIAYLIPDFNHWLVTSFNTLRTDTLFASFWYNYTRYMIYAIVTPLSLLYLAAFKVDELKPYRTVLLLAVMTLAIGIPLVDTLKYLSAVPRPYILYPDVNSLYHVGGSSFPSGHAFQAFAGTLPLIICFLTNDATFKRNWKKIVLATILLIFAITLSFSRILAGVHYLSDVLFGIGLAILMTVTLTIILQWLLDTGKLNLQNEIWYALIFLILIFIDLFFL